MLVMHKQKIVTLADLRFVCIKCPLCRTEVSMDMQEPSEVAKRSFTPRKCPGCDAAYDSAIVNGVDALQRLYGQLLLKAEALSFYGETEQISA